MVSSPLRIAFVVTRSDAIGGAQIHVRDLAGALHDEGHAVRVWVGGQGPFVDVLRRRGLAVEPLQSLVAPLRPWTDVRGVLELRRALASFRPELVTLHSSKAGTLGRLAARGLGVPVVYTAHGWPFVEGVPRVSRAIYRLVERLTAPLADRLVTVSEHDRRLARGAGVGTDAQLVRVHNGVPDVPPGPNRLAHSAASPSPTPVAPQKFKANNEPFTRPPAAAAARATPTAAPRPGPRPSSPPSRPVTSTHARSVAG